MSVIYKIVFEVKLLHEFYLTDSKGESIFDFNNQADRLFFLNKKFLADQENINSDIDFVLPGQLKRIFSDYRMKLVSTYAGFKVGVEVKQEILADGTITYVPVIPLPVDLNIQVLLLKKNDFLDRVTNKSLSKPLQAGFYFSNEAFTGARSFPFLSAEISSFQSTASYEQGELVKFGPNAYGEFYRDDANNEQHTSFSTAGYANDNDRLILSTDFYYSFPITANVTTADLVIKDADGNIIKDTNGNPVSVFHFSGTEPLGRVRISIDPSGIQSLPSALPHEKLLYQLEVTGNNGFTRKHKLFFASGETNPGTCSGLVNIKLKTTDPSYNIVDPDGKLMTRKKADGTIDPLPPLFEIRFKSKLSFWRYTNNLRKNILGGIHADFMLTRNGKLVSIAPRPVSYNPTLFKKADNTFHFFPNPERYAMIKIENNKLFSEITVRKSDLFPLEP
jgi:uncharacterized protein YbaA (DUF1428 family)